MYLSIGRKAIMALFILIFLMGLATPNVLGRNAEPLWGISGEAVDIAISDDGSVVAIVFYDSIHVYDGQGNLMWYWGGECVSHFSSVDISANGDVVTASAMVYDEEYGGRYVILYWGNARDLSGTPGPQWVSNNLYGRIGSEALTLSNNGDSVLAVGTGPNVFYWNQSLARGGSGIYPTWTDFQEPWELEYARMSGNGDFVVTGGTYNYIAKVYYYANSTLRSGYQHYDLNGTWTFYDSYLEGLDISDDGEHFVLGLVNNTDREEMDSYVHYYSHGEHVWSSSLPGYSIANVKISGNGEVVATVANSEEGLAVFFYKGSEKG